MREGGDWKLERALRRPGNPGAHTKVWRGVWRESCASLVGPRRGAGPCPHAEEARGAGLGQRSARSPHPPAPSCVVPTARGPGVLSAAEAATPPPTHRLILGPRLALAHLVGGGWGCLESEATRRQDMHPPNPPPSSSLFRRRPRKQITWTT